MARKNHKEIATTRTSPIAKAAEVHGPTTIVIGGSGKARTARRTLDRLRFILGATVRNPLRRMRVMLVATVERSRRIE